MSEAKKETIKAKNKLSNPPKKAYQTEHHTLTHQYHQTKSNNSTCLFKPKFATSPWLSDSSIKSCCSRSRKAACASLVAEVSTSVLASREGLEEGDSSSLRLEMGLAASPRTWRTFLPEAGGKKKQWKINYLLFVLLNFEPLRDVFLKIQVKNPTFNTIEDFTKDTVFF